MTKIIGMIPARMGSQRVPKKNLRLLAGKPLIAYIIEAAKASKLFDELYINSESDELRAIAEKYQLKFYQRPVRFAYNKANNDDFLRDFAEKHEADILVQLLPTSPLITAHEIKQFVQCLMDNDYDTLVSVVNHQIACVYQNKPINFSLTESHKSSQTMMPVQSYASVLMAWKQAKLLQHYKELGVGYHGGNGKVGYFSLKGFSTIDIDYEEDFQLAEVAIDYAKQASRQG